MLLPNALVLGVTQNIVRGIIKATREGKEKRKKGALDGTDASELILPSPKKEQGTLLSLPSKVESTVSPGVPTPSSSSPEVTTVPASQTKTVSPISDTAPKAPSLDAPTLPKTKGSVGGNLSELIPGIGSGIKKNVEAIVRSRLSGTPVSAKGLFDGIDDKTVEKSIPLAEDAIKRNLESGALGEDAADRYPNLLSGLTMFYAASERGKREAARRAREVAYEITPSKTVKPYNPRKQVSEIPVHFNEEDLNFIPEKSYDISRKQPQNNLHPNVSVNVNAITYDKSSTIYHGVAVKMKGDTFEDLEYSDYSKEQIIDHLGIPEKDFIEDEDKLIDNWKELARLSSAGDMQTVLLDMIDHFADGTGTAYSHEALTKAVKGHNVTKEFISGFTDVFNAYVDYCNGDIRSFAKSKSFKDALRKKDLLLSKFSYEGLDTFTGLTLAVHGWTECKVNVTSFNLKPDGTYTGNLEFTFVDDFGLDSDDSKDFHGLKGFKSWFILQHYNKFNGKYKPFRVYVKVNKHISGKINN